MNKYWLIIIIFCCKKHYAQIENIVFEGAGIRGIAYSGVIKALEEKKQLAQIKRIGGTSAGAITAALLCVGYNAIEIAQIIGSTKFSKFNDGGVPFFGGLCRLRKNYGWYKGDKFEKWMGKLIAAKTGNANIDFVTLEQNYKSLYVTGTSLDMQQAIVFSAESYPHMPIVKAVRISMSVPLYYKAMLMDSAGNFYKKMPKHPVHVMVDGGFMMNFPIRLFDSTKYITNTIKNEFTVNEKTIGCRIDAASQIALDYSNKRGMLAQKTIKRLPDYINAFVVILTERLNRQELTDADWKRTISIADGGIGPKVKGMPKHEIDTLVSAGYNASLLFKN